MSYKHTSPAVLAQLTLGDAGILRPSTTEDTMQATVRSNILSDGSKTYDVCFSDDVIFHTLSFKSACIFCDELAELMRKHTSDEPDFYWLG